MSDGPKTFLESGRLWPWFIALLLVATAGGQFVMVYAATHDPTFAVEPDYYKKAVAWDTTMVRERENLRLGWQAAGSMARTDAGAEVRIALTDSTGSPVAGAEVRVMAIHNLDGSHPVAIVLRESGPAYRGVLPDARRGLWELRLDVVRGTIHFTPSLRVDFPP